ncbi:hypothetical protein FFF34_003680 [Inquilinus sp. KBS0705]|nr:hypothetical protein FFF34_003680 [Inquilinus sp. KBS0705]
MKFKLFTVALGIALSATAISASAQKAYTEGVATYTLSAAQGEVESKLTFKGDSSVAETQQGPANIKLISDLKAAYFAILVDVPVASIKKAVVLTPADMEEAKKSEPTFTFTPGTETKVINGFNCTKVDVKETKSGKAYVAWVTKDITAPVNSYTRFYATAGGFPVQFTTIQQGQEANVTLKSITDAKAPKGAFAIPGDFDRISLEDLKAMAGGGN